MFVYCGNYENFINYIELFFNTIKQINNKKYILVLLNSNKNNKDKNLYIKYTYNVFIINMINISKNEDGLDLRYCTKVNKDIFFSILYEIYNL